MKRLIWKMVFFGFVTACLFASKPTSLSPVFDWATIDGVVRAPSAFSRIFGSPASITATAEFGAMFRQGAVAYAQPSVAKIGVSGMREVITLAATHNRIPHWFTEACAVWEQPDRRNFEAVRLLVDAVRTKHLFPVKELDWGFVRPQRGADQGCDEQEIERHAARRRTARARQKPSKPGPKRSDATNRMISAWRISDTSRVTCAVSRSRFAVPLCRAPNNNAAATTPAALARTISSGARWSVKYSVMSGSNAVPCGNAAKIRARYAKACSVVVTGGFHTEERAILT